MRKITLLAAILVLLPAVAAFAQAPAATPQPEPLAFDAARDYLEKSRYPEHSKVLQAGTPDPLRAERSTSPITVKSLDLPGAALSVWSEDVTYLPGERMSFFAVADGFAPAGITGEVKDATGHIHGSLVFHDDGADADQVAGDGVYTARFVPTKALVPELATAYQVTVFATRAEGESLTATTGFVLSNPWAELAGEYRHRLVDGNLVIEAKVDVRREGRFHLSGVLHTMDGEPVGTAQAAKVLEPGEHWLPLEFYGLMFHDRGVRGAVKLGSLALSTTGAMPNALGKLATDVHVVIPEKGVRYRDVPYGNPADLEAADRLQKSGQASLEVRGER